MCEIEVYKSKSVSEKVKYENCAKGQKLHLKKY